MSKGTIVIIAGPTYEVVRLWLFDGKSQPGWYGLSCKECNAIRYQNEDPWELYAIGKLHSDRHHEKELIR